MNITQAEDAAGITTVNDAFAELDPRRYGAVEGGLVDCTAAFQAMIDVLNVASAALPGQCFRESVWPAGQFLITGPMGKIVKSGVRIRGAGGNATRIICAGSNDYTALQIGADLPTSEAINFDLCDFSMLKLGGSNVTLLKVHYGQFSSLANINLFGIQGPCTCLEVAGHECISFRDLVLYGTNPLVLKMASDTPTEGADHFCFDGLEMLSTDNTQPLVKSGGPGMLLSNIKFTGNQVWLGGSCGFEFVNTALAGITNIDKLVFENIRREENGAGSSGELARIEPFGADECNSITWRNCSTGRNQSTMSGWRLKNVRRPTFEDCASTGGPIGVIANALNSNYELVTRNCALVSFTLTGYEKVFGDADGILTQGEESKTCVYQFSPTTPELQAARGARCYEGRIWVARRELASGAEFVIPGRSNAAPFAQAQVQISCGGPTLEWGNFITANAMIATQNASANVVGGDTAGKLCCYWDNAAGVAKVKNRLPGMRTVQVTVTWVD